MNRSSNRDCWGSNFAKAVCKEFMSAQFPAKISTKFPPKLPTKVARRTKQFPVALCMAAIAVVLAMGMRFAMAVDAPARPQLPDFDRRTGANLASEPLSAEKAQAVSQLQRAIAEINVDFDPISGS